MPKQLTGFHGLMRAGRPLFQEALNLQPVEKVTRPRMQWRLVFEIALSPETDPVGALLIDMQIERNSVLLQRGGKGERVLHLHRIVLVSMEEKAGRRILCDLLLIRKQIDQLLRRVVTEEVLF